MDSHTVKANVIAGLRKFYYLDLFLIKNDVNERSITHKLGIYLGELFYDWDVDCEYNRLGECNTDGECLQKKLNLITDSTTTTIDTDAKTVFPDMIIHHRGGTEREDNLLVIEAKKENKSTDFDKEKLKGYVSQLHYQYGLLIIISIQKITLSWTIDGYTWETEEMLVNSLEN